MQLKSLIKNSCSRPSFAKKIRRNESGQAIVEYILILVVAVGIILAATRIFYKPFSDYMTNYLGEYLQCVLETAELPSPNSASDECANKFSGGAGKNAGKNTKGSSGKGSDGQDKKDSDELAGKDDAGGSGEEGAGGGRRRPTRGRGKLGFITQQNDPGSVGEGDQKEFPLEGGAVDMGSGKSQRIGRVSILKIKRIRATGIGGAIAQEQEKQKKEEQKTKKLGKVPEDMTPNPQKKLRVKETRREVASMKEKSEDFSFGKWIRILFIVGIIIAIVVFMFMQLNNISKSWEK